jgi:hypothetical protein
MGHVPTTGWRACAVLLALVVCSACGAARTPSRVEAPPPSGNTFQYRSYSWWRPPLSTGPQGYSDDEERLDVAVRFHVENQLSARGYREDTLGRPDFVVRYGIAVYDRATPSFRDYLSYPAGSGGKDMGAGDGAAPGTFTLEALDAATGRVAWRRTAPGVFTHGPSQNPVKPAASQMMESFPQGP